MPGTLDKLRPIDHFPIAFHDAMRDLMRNGFATAAFESGRLDAAKETLMRSARRRLRAFLNSAADPRYSRAELVEWSARHVVHLAWKDRPGRVWALELLSTERRMPSLDAKDLSKNY